MTERDGRVSSIVVVEIVVTVDLDAIVNDNG